MTETVLWQTQRCPERGGVVERLTATDDGLRYDQIAGDADSDEPLDRREVFADVEEALTALPDLLHLFLHDVVPVCELPLPLLVEHLRLCQDGEEAGWFDPVAIGDRNWRWDGCVAMPCDVAPVASWSNGDRYDRPGGDYWSKLYRFGSLYVLEQADEPVEILGHLESETAAVADWLASLPSDTASLRTYLVTVDLRDDVDLEEVTETAPDPIALGHGMDAIYDLEELDEWWDWAQRPEWSDDPAVWIPAHEAIGSFDGSPLAEVVFDSGESAWLRRVGLHHVHGGSSLEVPAYLGRFTLTGAAYRRWLTTVVRPRTSRKPRANLAGWIEIEPEFLEGFGD